MDPEIDFGAIVKQFDTLLVGRRTFEMMAQANRMTMPGMKTIVFSRTLRATDYPEVTVFGDGQSDMLMPLRGKSGKDVWIFGGSSLFRSLLAKGFVDTTTTDRPSRLYERDRRARIRRQIAANYTSSEPSRGRRPLP